MTRFLGGYGPALAWAGLVVLLGGWSDLKQPVADLPIDKVAHFFLYAVLGALAARGWQRSGWRHGWWWPVLVVLALGAWDETRQRNVAGRVPELADWIADAAGAVVAFAVTGRILGTARKREGHEP